MSSESDPELGKLVAVYGIAPAYMQRAVFITVLSFLFFLAMMFVYYIRQSIGYFLLASAFLVLYLVTMFSWVIQRRSHVEIFENGFKYKNRSAIWSEIESIEGATINIRSGKPFILPKTLHDIETLLTFIQQKTASQTAGIFTRE